MSRVLLVGELNPYGSDDRFALYHLPRQASGNRLRCILGLTDGTYENLHKTNLCHVRWSVREARRRATLLMNDESSRPWDLIVACGAKVAAAFWYACTPEGARVHVTCGFLDVINFGVYNPGQVLYIPHPSGLNRQWHDTKLPGQIRSMLEDLAPDVPWGELLLPTPLPHPHAG